jgi:hypothetical protein
VSDEKLTEDQFVVHLLVFMARLHDCHVCKYQTEFINSRGKRRTICTKYNSPILRVRDSCIDRFSGFTKSDIKEIARQYKTGVIQFNNR